MSTLSLVPSKTDVALRSSPINPAWIREGTPKARNAELSRSHDGTASTMVWDCTAGRFEWFYDFDETIHFLEGNVTIESDTMPARHFGPGDVLFLPKGSHARWHVPTYIRKLAFCRRTLPKPVGFAIRVVTALRRRLMPSGGSGAMLGGAKTA